MDISSVCVRKAVSSTLYSSFSDESHLQFYGPASSFLAPSKLRFKLLSRSLPSVTSKPVKAPLRALCDTACKAPMELIAEQALMKELADLKLQMKQRKKELKAHMKDDKKMLKLQAKEEKKRKKQKDAQEGKTKVKCQSESSSSSESSDEECSSVSMKILRQGQSKLEDARLNDEEGSLLENCIASSAGISSILGALSKDGTVDVCDEVCPNFLSLNSDAMEGCTEKSLRDLPPCRGCSETCLTMSSTGSSFNGCTSIPKIISELVDVQNHGSICCKSGVPSQAPPKSHVLPTLHESNRIEVCTSGKCKKAGSEKLLLALQGQIPGSLNVEAVPCKCMGKCSTNINVRVVKEDTNPQHHSHVGVEDGSLILSHHFGLGSLSPKDGIRVPSPLVMA